MAGLPKGGIRIQKKRAKAAPYKEYKGDSHDAFWYFDKEMAEMTEERYRRERGKKPQYLGFCTKGAITHI